MTLLTHWGRVTHICVDKLTINGSDNGLSSDRRQAVIWTNAGLLSIGSLRTYFNENLIKIQQLSLRIMHVKMSSAKWRPSCPGLNDLIKTRLLCQTFIISKYIFGTYCSIPFNIQTQGHFVNVITAWYMFQNDIIGYITNIWARGPSRFILSVTCCHIYLPW